VSEVSRRVVVAGCFNVRDLGGHQTEKGGWIRWRSVVRSDAPYGLAEGGWERLWAYGIRTLVDLRSPSEVEPAVGHPDMVRINVPLGDSEDAAFIARWRGVYDRPRYCRESIERWPERHARAVTAIARAAPGGVLVHCRFGRDRTGVLVALLLRLAGVPLDVIAADYAISAAQLRPVYERLMSEAPDETARRRLQRENVSAASTITRALATLDVREYLLSGGATAPDLDLVVDRLVEGLPRQTRGAVRPRAR
jgi:protein tyrosine/serine phosphatase